MKKCLVASALIGFCVVLGCSKEEAQKIEPAAVADSLDHLAATGEFEPFDTPPSLLDAVTPVYPEEARKEGLQGTVRVKVVVGVDGLVESAEVLESSGAAILDEAALESAKNYRFNPATREGAPVRCAVVLPVHYRLGD